MAKTANINLRIDPKIKDQAEIIYDELGLTLADAINIFLKKSISEGGLPFDLKKTSADIEREMVAREARLVMYGSLASQNSDSLKNMLEDQDIAALEKFTKELPTAPVEAPKTLKEEIPVRKYAQDVEQVKEDNFFILSTDSLD